MQLFDLDLDTAMRRHRPEPSDGKAPGIGHRAAHEHRILHLAIAIFLNDPAGVAEIGVCQPRLVFRRRTCAVKF